MNKIYAAIAFAIMFMCIGPSSIAQCVSNAKFNFANAAGASTIGKQMRYQGVTLTITQTVQAGSTLTYSQFNDDDKPDSLRHGIWVQQDANPGGLGIRNKLEFSKPLTQLKLSLWDVDGNTGSPGKRDSVAILAYSGPTLVNLVPANYTLGSVVSNTNPNQFRANTGTNATANSNVGDINVTFPVPIDSVIIVTSQSSAGAPGAQHISIGDLSWCNTPAGGTCTTPGAFTFPTTGAVANGAMLSSGAVTMTITRQLLSGTFNSQNYGTNHRSAVGGIVTDVTTAPGSAGLKIKLAFNKKLQRLNMSFWDVDGADAGNKKDSIKVIGYAGAVALNLDSTNYSFGNSLNGEDNNNEFKSRQNLPSDLNESNGDINIEFPLPVDSVIIFTSQGAGGTGNHTFTISGMSWCNALEQTLPVKVSGFKGNLNEQSSNLSWNTYDESTLQHTELERSEDGSVYYKINTIAPKGKHSNQYSYSDPLNGAAKVYYRLTFVDKDGSKIYSNTLLLRKEKPTGKGLQLLPNPARAYVQLSFEAEREGVAEIRIIDGSGRVVLLQKERAGKGNNGAIVQNLQNLHEGIYSVQLIVDGKIQIQKLVISR